MTIYFFQAEDGIRDIGVTGVQTCALPIYPRELEEERRLAYVGITRAQKRLYLSRAQVRTSWGQPAYNPPSRFLDELPADTVHWARAEPVPTMSGYGNSAQARVAATGLSTGGLRGGAGNRPVISVEPGDRVSHDAFGLGTVVEVTGAGDKAQATVDFGSGGTKIGRAHV